jgi:hypothetical protein
VLRQGQQGRLVAVCGVVLAVADAGVMVDQQFQARMALGDLADQRQIVRGHQCDRDPGLLGSRPQPVHRAIGHPIGLVRLGEGVTQPEHPRPALPGVDQRAVFRPFGRKVAEDPKAVRVFGRCFFRDLARVRVPARRVQQAGIDPGGIHIANALLGRIRGDLAVRRIGRRTGRPDVDLCVDDQHVVPLTGYDRWRSCYAMSLVFG